MKRKPAVTCVGELLVDFISMKRGADLSNVPAFAKCPGGAAANVAVGLARLGVSSAFVGKVGDDSFGRFLRREVGSYGVDVSGIRMDGAHKTRLAFVSLSQQGERDFEFWERHPADEQLRLSDVDLDRVSRSAIVHIGSFLLVRDPSRSTALAVAAKLHRRGCLLSFDPNLRLSLWKSAREAKRVLLQMSAVATVLRLNEEEAAFLTGERSMRAATGKLLSAGPSIVVVTRGSRGCLVRTAGHYEIVEGFRVKVADTTGCGDAFLAGLLRGIVSRSKHPRALSPAEVSGMCRYANAVGALASMRYGAITAVPGPAEVRRFLSNKS